MVKFISYSGGYPALCIGELILDIDGEEVSFGSGDSMYDFFWSSGGKCYFTNDWSEEHIEEGDWICNEDDLPDKYRGIAEEIFAAFRDNVPKGCCGGCL